MVVEDLDGLCDVPYGDLTKLGSLFDMGSGLVQNPGTYALFTIPSSPIISMIAHIKPYLSRSKLINYHRK